jgi:hypothetical protein
MAVNLTFSEDGSLKLDAAAFQEWAEGIETQITEITEGNSAQAEWLDILWLLFGTYLVFFMQVSQYGVS